MTDESHNITAEILKQQLEEGKRYAARDDDGHGAGYDKNRKFLGIIPAQSQALSGLLYGLWLTGVEVASGPIQTFFDTNYSKVLKSRVNPKTINTLAAGTTIAIAAIPFIEDIFSGSQKLKKERKRVAGKIRPLLEEVTGKSGLKALMGVKQEQNEVLFVQRKRFSDDIQHRLKDDILMMSFSSAPTAVTSLARTNKIGGANSSSTSADSPVNKISAMISFAMPQVAGMFNEESKRAYKQNRQKYTALEMIVNLDEQLRDMDFASGKFVDSFSLPENDGSKSLTGYIAEIFKQHQRDMEKINPEHSPLRSALDSQLDEISKDIAEAIKRGDIAPLSLARLAGERIVIKNRGRALAKPSDVRAAMQKMSSNTLNYLRVDSVDYYGESSFSRKDLKEALKSLSGEDRIVFLALIPDDILKEAGVSSAEIQKIRDMSSQLYESKLAQIVTGLAGHDDDKLADIGLAKEEIEQLRKVSEAIRSKGSESIREYRAKPTDPAGIERVVTNAVVNRVQGNKQYLGSLVRKGQSLMQVAPAEEISMQTHENPAAESSQSASNPEEPETEAITMKTDVPYEAHTEHDDEVSESISQASGATREDTDTEPEIDDDDNDMDEPDVSADKDSGTFADKEKHRREASSDKQVELSV